MEVNPWIRKDSERRGQTWGRVDQKGELDFDARAGKDASSFSIVTKEEHSLKWLIFDRKYLEHFLSQFKAFKH